MSRDDTAGGGPDAGAPAEIRPAGFIRTLLIEFEFFLAAIRLAWRQQPQRKRLGSPAAPIHAPPRRINKTAQAISLAALQKLRANQGAPELDFTLPQGCPAPRVGAAAPLET